MKENKNPWLGLESYQEGEILYGRDDDILNLGQCVLRDDVTLLYGKSGIGKTSILNAGILPAARRNGYVPVKVRLQHKDVNSYFVDIEEYNNPGNIEGLSEIGSLSSKQLYQRYGKSYIMQLHEAIINEGIEVKDEQFHKKDIVKESIYEYFHSHSFYDKEGKRIRLLILFDQFEEMFTLQTNELVKKHFFYEIGDFINDILPDYLRKYPTQTYDADNIKSSCKIGIKNILGNIRQNLQNEQDDYVNDNVIHVVLTIREDFLSEFEYYTSAIPALKQNRYGLRPLNEEQAAQIIMRPIPGFVNKDVTKLIIEKITGRKDFKLDGIPEIEVDSAVLSWYMNRLYEARTESQITSDIVERKGDKIISDFYKDAISEVSKSSVDYL